MAEKRQSPKARYCWFLRHFWRYGGAPEIADALQLSARKTKPPKRLFIDLASHSSVSTQSREAVTWILNCLCLHTKRFRREAPIYLERAIFLSRGRRRAIYPPGPCSVSRNSCSANEIILPLASGAHIEKPLFHNLVEFMRFRRPQA